MKTRRDRVPCIRSPPRNRDGAAAPTKLEDGSTIQHTSASGKESNGPVYLNERRAVVLSLKRIELLEKDVADANALAGLVPDW
jgi:hypothetical protein